MFKNAPNRSLRACLIEPQDSRYYRCTV